MVRALYKTPFIGAGRREFGARGEEVLAALARVARRAEEAHHELRHGVPRGQRPDGVQDSVSPAFHVHVERGSVDEIGYPKKSCGHYKVSKNVLMTQCSVKKCLIDAI